MRRLAVAVTAVAAAIALAAPASAIWPPVCKPIVYDNTGICI